MATILFIDVLTNMNVKVKDCVFYWNHQVIIPSSLEMGTNNVHI